MREPWSRQNKRRLAVAAAVLCLGILYIVTDQYVSDQSLLSENDETDSIETDVSSEEISMTSEESESEEVSEIAVHVSGAVENPDQVYLMEEGDRVYDAIEAAGGLTEDADPSQLNLAEKLYDGEKIYVPEEGEEIESSLSTGSSSEISSEDALININTATEDELETLPGIGEVYAARIVAYREENGDFETIEDIQNVSGIGEATFEKLKDLITV